MLMVGDVRPLLIEDLLAGSYYSDKVVGTAEWPLLMPWWAPFSYSATYHMVSKDAQIANKLAFAK